MSGCTAAGGPPQHAAQLCLAFRCRARAWGVQLPRQLAVFGDACYVKQINLHLTVARPLTGWLVARPRTGHILARSAIRAASRVVLLQFGAGRRHPPWIAMAMRPVFE